MASNIQASAKLDGGKLVVGYETEDTSLGSDFGSAKPGVCVTNKPAPGGEVLEFTTRNGHKHTSGVFPADFLGKGNYELRMIGDKVLAVIPLGGTSANALKYFYGQD